MEAAAGNNYKSGLLIRECRWMPKMFTPEQKQEWVDSS